MSSVLERAVQGNRSAMHRVYETERKYLYFLCLRLSDGESEAAALFCASLSRLWEDASPRDAASPHAFRLLVSRSAALSCPEEAPRSEPPEPVWTLSLSPESSAAELLDAIVRRLPRTQRLLFLLRHAAGLSEREAAGAAGGDTSAAEGLLRRAEQTVKRQLSLLKYKLNLTNAPAPRDLDRLLRAMTEETLVPDELDAEAAAIILRASHPARVSPFLIAAVVCLFLAAGIWLASAITGSPSGDQESASADSTASIEDDASADGTAGAEDDASADDTAGAEDDASADDTAGAEDDGSADDTADAEDDASADDTAGAEDDGSADDTAGAEDDGSADTVSGADEDGSAA